MRYEVKEQAQGNFSAYVPDLPVCVATGATIAEIEQQIREAIEFHLDGISARFPSGKSRVNRKITR